MNIAHFLFPKSGKRIHFFMSVSLPKDLEVGICGDKRVRSQDGQRVLLGSRNQNTVGGIRVKRRQLRGSSRNSSGDGQLGQAVMEADFREPLANGPGQAEFASGNLNTQF